MSVRRVKYQIISKSISGSGVTVTVNDVTTDSLYEKVTGVFFNTADATAIKKSKFTKFQIDGQEVFPTDYEAILINTGQDVPPDQRFKELDERAKNSPVAITYVDGANAAAYPHVINIYLRLENPPYDIPERSVLKQILERLGAVSDGIEKWFKKPE